MYLPCQRKMTHLALIPLSFSFTSVFFHIEKYHHCLSFASHPITSHHTHTPQDTWTTIQ